MESRRRPRIHVLGDVRLESWPHVLVCMHGRTATTWASCSQQAMVTADRFLTAIRTIRAYTQQADDDGHSVEIMTSRRDLPTSQHRRSSINFHLAFSIFPDLPHPFKGFRHSTQPPLNASRMPSTCEHPSICLECSDLLDSLHHVSHRAYHGKPLSAGLAR